MKKTKWGDTINNRNFTASVVKRFMTESEFKAFAEKYGETRSCRKGWEATKEDWAFNAKFPKATVDLWAEHWNIGADSAWKRLGKMYLLGRSMPTR